MKKLNSPQKKTRNLEESRREILAVAFSLIYRHGFQGVSVDDIVKKTTMTKGAFYHQFPTKLDLGYALVEEVIQPMILKRWIEPLSAYQNPLDGILRLLKQLIGEASAAELRLGCPLNNLVQEMSSVDQGFKKRLQTALNYWIDGLHAELKRGQKNGSIRPDADLRQAAQFIVMAHEGFYGLLKGIDDPKIFNPLLAALKNYFGTLRP